MSGYCVGALAVRSVKEEVSLSLFPRSVAIFLGVISICGLATPATASAQEATVINIGFVLISNVLTPVPAPGHHTAYAATLILSGNNRVTEKWKSENISGVNSNYHSEDTGLGGRWRVVSPNTIMASWQMLNFTKSVTVRVSGKACTVKFETQLVPGEAEYKTKRGGTVYTFSKPSMLDPTCSIQ